MTIDERTKKLRDIVRHMEPAFHEAEKRARCGTDHGNESRLGLVLRRARGGFIVLKFEAEESGWFVTLTERPDWESAKQAMFEWTGSEYALRMEEPA